MPTQAQQAQAEQEKNKKMQQEAALAILLLSLISRMARAAKSTYLADQQVIDLNTFRRDLEKLLLKSYNKTTLFFSNAQIANLEAQMGVRLSDDERKELRTILQNEAKQTAVSQASQIIKTMQSDLNDIFFEAESLLKDKNKVAVNASRDWKTKTNARVQPTIVNTQVQSSAEGAKDTTALFMLTRLGAQAGISGMGKTWITVGDDRVRPAHAAANGETVPINQPFIVGGEKLFFPGDPRGSPWNIINCRCSSLTLALR